MTQKYWPKLKEIYQAARIWYGRDCIDSLCLAENRLMRGEKP